MLPPYLFFSGEKCCKYTTIDNTRQGFQTKTSPFWQTFNLHKTGKLSSYFSISLIFSRLFLDVKEKVFQKSLFMLIYKPTSRNQNVTTFWRLSTSMPLVCRRSYVILYIPARTEASSPTYSQSWESQGRNRLKPFTPCRPLPLMTMLAMSPALQALLSVLLSYLIYAYKDNKIV